MGQVEPVQISVAGVGDLLPLPMKGSVTSGNRRWMIAVQVPVPRIHSRLSALVQGLVPAGNRGRPVAIEASVGQASRSPLVEAAQASVRDPACLWCWGSIVQVLMAASAVSGILLRDSADTAVGGRVSLLPPGFRACAWMVWAVSRLRPSLGAEPGVGSATGSLPDALPIQGVLVHRAMPRVMLRSGTLLVEVTMRTCEIALTVLKEALFFVSESVCAVQAAVAVLGYEDTGSLAG
ncbi:MAG: hypothetical protein RLZZ165_291 [Bacteroidota bacterium]